ncbi:MAG: glycosyltransferase [Chitinophagales bacterium]
MTFFIIVCLLLTSFYLLLIGIYVFGWVTMPDWIPKQGRKNFNTSVSILIPARNEEAHIIDCLRAILEQQYPAELLEIIVIDDFSTDKTTDLVEYLVERVSNLQLLQLKDLVTEEERKNLNSFKKKALELAIAQSQYELIITTDADCVMNPLWLQTIVGFYEEHHPQLIAAPVCYKDEQNFAQRFQSLDFMGMMVSTGASVNLKMADMSNGANMAYTRVAFEAVNGFEGIDHIASGDDMLLMTKISKKFPNQIRFLKSLEATVYTYPQPDWSNFAQQRLRWASKSAQYKDKRITFFLAAVYLFNVSMVVNLIGGILGNLVLLKLFAGQFIFKSIFDFVYLRTACRFFNRNELLSLFLPAQLMHILYIIIIGAWSQFGKFEWKGRKVR